MGEIMGGNILKLRSEEIFEEDYEDGHVEGRNEEKKIIALRMFRAGMKLDNIAHMVAASEDEIRSWTEK